MVASPLQLGPPAPAPSPAASTAAPGSPWLVSPRFDLAFFLFSGLIVLIPLIATRYFAVDPYLILSAVAVTSNGPHLSSTWSRVYLDSRELRRRPVALAVIPALIAAAVIATIQLTPQAYRILTSVVLYWATWHFAAQCYGLLRLYQRKSGEAPRAAQRAEGAFVFSFALFTLLYRIHFGPRTLFSIEAYTPTVPFAVVALAGAVVAASVLLVAVDQVRRALAGERVPWQRLAFLGATGLGFGVPFLVMRDGTAGFAAAACWHGLQYLGIVYHFNRNKYRGGVPREARLVGWVSQPGRAVAYGALMLGLVGTVYGSLFVIARYASVDLWRLSLGTWVTLTLSHYWVDGVIWKMRRDESNRRLLAV